MCRVANKALNRIPAVQECDARMSNRITKASPQKKEKIKIKQDCYLQELETTN